MSARYPVARRVPTTPTAPPPTFLPLFCYVDDMARRGEQAARLARLGGDRVPARAPVRRLLALCVLLLGCVGSAWPATLRVGGVVATADAEPVRGTMRAHPAGTFGVHREPGPSEPRRAVTVM